MSISAATYERVALEDSNEIWELACGRLRCKPTMTTEHNDALRDLRDQLREQLDRRTYTVSDNSARLRISTGSYYVPDVCVIPREFVRRLRAKPGTFEVYDEPVPLVAEVWSPSTGDYDVEQKLREYQQRGDLEIWRIHPYERTLTRWIRRPDGSYQRSIHLDETAVQPVALPGVTIELERLFEV